MQKSFTFQLLRILALMVLTSLIPGREARAQTAPAVGLTGAITNGNVTLIWPVLRGNWELLEQQPAFNADWKPVPAEHYHTNAFGVSVTLHLPKKAALYRLKHSLNIHPGALPAMPEMPPLPPPSTNRPKPFKTPAQP